MVLVPVRPHRLLALVLFAAASISFVVAGAEPAPVFITNCAPCHGKDGKARTPAARKLGVKDLTQSKISAAEIERQIRDGRKNPEGKQQMPAFGERLTPEEIKQLISVVKELRKE